jgi:hypothetical protein
VLVEKRENQPATLRRRTLPAHRSAAPDFLAQDEADFGFFGFFAFVVAAWSRSAI